MNDHRLPASSTFRPVPISRPFSNFDYVDAHYNSRRAIRRLFSQARSYDCVTLIEEDIPPTGIIADENKELAALYRDYTMLGLKRMSFWAEPVETERDIKSLTSAEPVGYAILKRDAVPSRGVDCWHVFESVFVKYPHRHNCIHGDRKYRLRVGGRVFEVSGVMYCQQNTLNKACAQVALRTLCTMHLPDTELPYSRINKLAERASGKFDRTEGLNAKQIQAVLHGLGIGFTDVDYTLLSDADRHALPYQKYLYAGIESGAGAMLGFKLTGPKAEGRHIIPFFGHTFNQDAWVPNAEATYFHVGEQTRYLPSESWLSSFIGHDDNFGSNFCVPRLYVTCEQAQYVVALQPAGVCYGGMTAEAIAVEYLYSLLPHLGSSGVRWLDRLIWYADEKHQEVVLRAVALTREQYADHLREIRDWDNHTESRSVCASIEAKAPEHLWLVEVSVPELFPANQRKLGEIVLDATEGACAELDFSSYLFARFPSRFVVVNSVDAEGKPEFISYPSRLRSHTPVFGTEDAEH